MRRPADAIPVLAIALALAGATPVPVRIPSPNPAGVFLPDSLRSDSLLISIYPDSLVDSSGTFTAPDLRDASAPALAPGPVDDRLEELRRRIRYDRHDVSARRELGDLLASSREIELRREAAEAFRQALRVAGHDPDLWVRFARLQERRGFHAEAHDAYRTALRLAPERWDIWESVAQHEFIRFQRQLLWKHLEDARRANEHVLQVKPDDVASIRLAIRIGMLENNRAAVDSLVTKWEQVAPEDPWGMLVRGMLFAEGGAWERADLAFTRGLAALPEPERRPFFRLDIVDPRAEERRKESPDRTRFFRDYWKWRDPTPADAVNPRLLEHYRRMVQAELIFALDSYHLHGWNHAPGEMLVRYGLPKGWSFQKGFGRLQDYYVTATSLVASRSVEIAYGPEAFPILFVDYNQNGRFYYPINGWPLDGELDLAEHPSAYASPFLTASREQEVEAWRFQDGKGGGRIEVAVALPRGSWPKELLEKPYRLATKLTVYDARWAEADALIGSWAPFRIDPLGRLVARFEATGSADSLILGLETSDRDETLRAAGYTELSPRPSHPEPELSDLAFVSGVSFENPGGAYGWTDGSAIPNPGHRYRAGDAIGIAFEAYGLHLDQSGESQARIRVSVARQTRTGWLRVLLGKRKGGGEAELVFDASESGSTLHQLLALELPPLDPGKYLLRLRVEDKESAGAAERSGLFEILDPGWKR